MSKGQIMSSASLRMLPPTGRLKRLAGGDTLPPGDTPDRGGPSPSHRGMRRAGSDVGSLRLIERHARVYRHAWLVFASGVFEPLFYLLSVGLGLGVLVGKVPGPGGHPIPYREFVAPGLLAVSSMNGAMYDSTFNVFFRLKAKPISTATGTARTAHGECTRPIPSMTSVNAAA